MEMHTRESLRRVHGIDMRPAVARVTTHRLTYSECHRMACHARSKVIRRAISGASKQFAGLVTKFVSSIKHDLRSRKAERALMQLSDWQLRDIGITRSEIHLVVRHGLKPDC